MGQTPSQDSGEDGVRANRGKPIRGGVGFRGTRRPRSKERAEPGGDREPESGQRPDAETAGFRHE
jgi:hypothetical protein